MNYKLTIPLMSMFALFLLAFTNGCGNDKIRCTNTMCSMQGVEMTESEVRQRASVYAYKEIVQRQKRLGTAIVGPDYKPIRPMPIDPNSWEVSKRGNKWYLKRHVTRDLWQTVKSNLDGTQATNGMEVGDPPNK